MTSVWLGVFLLAVAAAAIVSAAVDGECSAHSTCGDCIMTPQCQWCSSHVTGKSKCVHVDQTKKPGWCDGTPVVVQTEHKTTDGGSNSSWLLPKRVKVSLRVREDIKLNVTYRRVEDYPVDLYYLMDLSASMRDDKDKLSKLGDLLTEAMRNITLNFRLGFGSFVDKVAMPFVNTHPDKINKPCDACVRAYSFKNHMPLTDDTAQFARKVNETPVSGNVDHPEGGFDALMQAMVCTNEIKWRTRARHLLVMATDASFHIAGDGKLAGIVEPNDEACHMVKGEYTHGLVYDYPSVAQLNRQAQNHSTTLIFAVTKEQEKMYRALTERILGSKMGTLSNDSANVVDLVLEVYEQLVDSVKMTDDSANKGVSVLYKASCVRGMGELEDGNTCHKIHARENVTFEVTLRVNKCPSNVGKVWKETITFSPNGIEETMTVDLEVYCGCPCEQAGNEGYEKNSTSCKNHGDKKCGMCSCYEEYSGQECQCALDHISKKESLEGCMSDGVLCNNRGSCICNVCSCSKRQNPEEHVYGPFCECDNFSCVRREGEICSGRGYCNCGQCVCNSGWKGEDCSCRDSLQTCRESSVAALCSNAGECVCGGCQCNKGHSGEFCEDCMTCPGGRCKSVAKCVEHLAYGTGEYDAELCDPKNITLVEKRKQINEDVLEKNEKFCRHPDDAGCSFVFTYEEFNHGFIIIAEEEKQCPAAINLLGIIFGVIGGTVLIGLVTLLIWKLLTSIHDQREFAKFENERAQSKWERGENPIFVQATSTFSNPTFSGN